MEDTVTITRKRYEDLLEARDLLKALEDEGVDRWEGYDEAISSFYKEKED